MIKIEDGPGLKVIGKTKWFGPGYCGVCGTRGKDLVPRSVRWWDPDDGWKMGVLCRYCLDEVRDRGPRPDDYAVVTRTRADADTRIDVNAALGDEDGAYSDQ